ncbi:hypothetical protein [Streptomyces sp. NPDC090080]|uniref:hypothetical protein n=1 Tax=Streptomyces sp. NPDC090080 TaxID=3365939 RepID=UPI003824A0A0
MAEKSGGGTDDVLIVNTGAIKNGAEYASSIGTSLTRTTTQFTESGKKAVASHPWGTDPAARTFAASFVGQFQQLMQGVAQVGQSVISLASMAGNAGKNFDTTRNDALHNIQDIRARF